MSKQGPFVAKTLVPPASWPVLAQRVRQFPPSASCRIQRYDVLSVQAPDEGGLFVYNQTALPGEDPQIEVRFVLEGLTLTVPGDKEGTTVSGLAADFIQLQFGAAQLVSLAQDSQPGQRNEAILAFTHPNSFVRAFPLNPQIRRCLEALVESPFNGAMDSVHAYGLSQSLLVFALDSLHQVPEEAPVFQCRFLADQGGRDRILAARDILLQHIGNPITIKELSRKVAINECYLKKGFKEVFGTTIFDFYQQQRMAHARFLLNEKGLSVTDVSHLLGYSSISHFSAAFKRHTGLKPCELLK